ncbi:MAG: hypothetical protein JNK65_05555, partial [Deltaproteobacteria bacterium]|nr:hypothetical protein [Deltaproteobacteria bacterium]
MWPIFVLSGITAYLLSGCERRNNNSPEPTISPSARPYVPPAIQTESFQVDHTEASVSRNQSN